MERAVDYRYLAKNDDFNLSAGQRRRRYRVQARCNEM